MAARHGQTQAFRARPRYRLSPEQQPEGDRQQRCGPSLALERTAAGPGTLSSGINTSGGFNNRVEVAYAPSNGNIVYASSGFNNGTIYKSTNGGEFVHPGEYRQRLSRIVQGWYDNVIWVDPKKPANLLVAGGIDLVAEHHRRAHHLTQDQSVVLRSSPPMPITM